MATLYQLSYDGVIVCRIGHIRSGCTHRLFKRTISSRTLAYKAYRGMGHFLTMDALYQLSYDGGRTAGTIPEAPRVVKAWG